MPEVILYISPDRDKPVFAPSVTGYSFDAASHIFTGQNTEFMSPNGMEGLCSIVAKFNFFGELEHGHIKVIGGISSMGIPNKSVLLHGKIVNVDTFFGDSLFKANFLFRIEQDHPTLGYTSHFGVWNCYMSIPNWPEFYLRYLFRKSWGPAGAGLNSYIGQVSKIV